MEEFLENTLTVPAVWKPYWKNYILLLNQSLCSTLCGLFRHNSIVNSPQILTKIDHLFSIERRELTNTIFYLKYKK